MNCVLNAGRAWIRRACGCSAVGRPKPRPGLVWGERSVGCVVDGEPK